jgi:S-phase kinase-associated protein 1
MCVCVVWCDCLFVCVNSVSQDLDKIPVPKKVATMSELVKTMAEGDKDEKEIPLPNVKTPVLNKVVAYMKYHVDNPAKEIEKPLKSANMNEVVSQWDSDFIDVDQELLFELILVWFQFCLPCLPSCLFVFLTLGR